MRKKKEKEKKNRTTGQGLALSSRIRHYNIWFFLQIYFAWSGTEPGADRLDVFLVLSFSTQLDDSKMKIKVSASESCQLRCNLSAPTDGQENGIEANLIPNTFTIWRAGKSVDISESTAQLSLFVFVDR